MRHNRGMGYIAKKVLATVKRELGGRKGLGWDGLDDETQQDIEASLLEVIGNSLKADAIDVQVRAESIAACGFECEAGPLHMNIHYQQLLDNARADAAEVEELRVQLAGCLVAAEGGTSPDVVAHKNEYGWSLAYQQTLDLRFAYNDLIRAESETITDQVSAFHKAFGYPLNDTPDGLSISELNLRRRLITEEYLEYMRACGYDVPASVEHLLNTIPLSGEPDIFEMADALGDMDYINEGTRLTFGIPRQVVANEIQRSNMAKVGGATDEHGKLQKPEGWTPPDIKGVMLDYWGEPDTGGD
jgi:predicted HAD superfamily Cof-like phosphohydrolase